MTFAATCRSVSTAKGVAVNATSIGAQSGGPKFGAIPDATASDDYVCRVSGPRRSRCDAGSRRVDGHRHLRPGGLVGGGARDENGDAVRVARLARSNA